jgi:hypothetical protein
MSHHLTTALMGTSCDIRRLQCVGREPCKKKISPSQSPNSSTRVAHDWSSSRQSTGDTELPTQSISSPASPSGRTTRHETDAESTETRVRTRQSTRALFTCIRTQFNQHDGSAKMPTVLTIQLGDTTRESPCLKRVEAHEGERGVQNPGSG